MTLKSKLYYWAECDGEGCTQRAPGDDDDASAWDDPSLIFEDSDELTWFKTDDGKTWCPLHAPGRLKCGWCNGGGMVRTTERLGPPYEDLFRADTCAPCEGRGWIADPEVSPTSRVGESDE